LKVTYENTRIRIRESVSQMYGSADPDPYQNVRDPQHRKEIQKLYYIECTKENGSDASLLDERLGHERAPPPEEVVPRPRQLENHWPPGPWPHLRQHRLEVGPGTLRRAHIRQDVRHGARKIS
jgi:hypothetical protein